MTQPKNFTVDNPTDVTFKVNPESRTIKGLALPFGKPAGSGYSLWQFAAGSVTWDKVKLLNAHDWDQVIGVVELEETDEGLLMTAKVAKTRLGDEVLALAEMGAIDGLSVGIGGDIQSTYKDGVDHVTNGTVLEVSTTPLPAFADAQIRSVQASQPTKETKMGDENKPGGDAAIATLEAKFSDLEDKLAKLETFKTEPTAGLRAEVKEEPLYRFDGTVAASGRDFSTDLFAGLRGDDEAMTRVIGFMNESLTKGLKFVSSTDVEDVNPAVYRPDLFKDEAPAQPAVMYETFYAGSLDSVTPFFYSKMGSYANLIGPHTEGVSPTAGSFSTEAGATITPSPVSGRVYIPREVADQGGSPNVSGLIAEKVQRSFRESLEKRAAALMHTSLSQFATLATPSTGATGAAIGKALKQGLVDLQFTADGGRFRRFFAAKQLYSQLAAAEDDAHRPLFPILSPANADGTATSRLGAIDVAGIKLEPTWSTEIKYGEPAASDDTSFYVDPDAVKIWNSGLTKLEKVHEDAAGWNVDVFAYVATHLYDAAGVRKLTYKIA